MEENNNQEEKVNEIKENESNTEMIVANEEIPNEIERIKISNEAVATYAGIAVSEVKGV